MPTTTQQQREAAEEISQAFLLAYNMNDPDKIDDVVADEFVAHHTAEPEDMRGADAYKQRITDINAGFSDFHMDQELMLVDGDMGAAMYRWTGTHDGEFMGIPATNRTVDTKSITLSRMEDGKLVEMWVYTDTPGLMRQLGIEMGN
ncbi:ester cyclase [Halorarius litoreus]|uniref:ester cyclase n=1 Tax=Halorarius litoreus TaxID=2962676 RepID=UPI0020CE8454|nr:ester cyclase [Halorarius litoreus]